MAVRRTYESESPDFVPCGLLWLNPGHFTNPGRTCNHLEESVNVPGDSGQLATMPLFLIG